MPQDTTSPTARACLKLEHSLRAGRATSTEFDYEKGAPQAATRDLHQGAHQDYRAIVRNVPQGSTRSFSRECLSKDKYEKATEISPTATSSAHSGRQNL